MSIDEAMERLGVVGVPPSELGSDPREWSVDTLKAYLLAQGLQDAEACGQDGVAFCVGVLVHARRLYEAVIHEEQFRRAKLGELRKNAASRTHRWDEVLRLMEEAVDLDGTIHRMEALRSRIAGIIVSAQEAIRDALRPITNITAIYGEHTLELTADRITAT